MTTILQFLWTIVQILGAALMWISILLFIVKTLWNFAVPYAIIHEAIQRPKNKHGWSLFILLDLGLLMVALVGSALAGQYGVISTWATALYGIGAIGASYVHLVTVLLFGGLFLGLFSENRQNNDPSR